MKVEIQVSYSTIAESVIEISEEEVTTCLKKYRKMTRNQAIEWLVGENVLANNYEYDDWQIDYIRELK
ncbi:hypothetical protein LCGC14_2193200 [marine sediment metagenome]|uniref:Uncharacterized protein n=1 Tax=marine sediment metagenome TaxID=412755 RepID=A0A0F9DIX8_9ZZZZ